MSDALQYAVADRVATLTLNRPEARNPLSPEVVSAFVASLHAADADRDVKAILIRAEGDNFSAGGDIKTFKTALESEPAARFEMFGSRLAVGSRLPQALIDTRKPIVTATRGAAAGAGMALCLGADFVVSGKTSFFLAAHVLVGLSLDCGLSGLLVATVGLKQAKRLALLGDKVGAEEALALGMITKIVDDADVDAEARKLAMRLAAGPSTAMEGSRRLLNEAAHRHFAEELNREGVWLATCAASNDFRTGVENFLQRERRPFD
ncbi:MAG: enoyl-CoA hydratase/isomerase family protein [Thiobacillus sp.]